jgi:hypothetical protein
MSPMASSSTARSPCGVAMRVPGMKQAVEVKVWVTGLAMVLPARSVALTFTL